MKYGWIVGTALVALGQGAAQAQETYYWPAPVAQTQSSRMTEFPMGTPISLVTRTEANTKQMKPGDRIYLEVAESLSYRGQIVVPVGAPAVAEIVRSERNGHFGKRGVIELRLLYAETPSGPVRLTGGTSGRGKSAAIWSIGGAVAVLGWAPLLIHGTSGYIRHGTPVTAYLAEPLLFAQSASQDQAVAMVPPESARALPDRFDPSVFGGKGPALSQR